ncbi:MAG: hypothetical protein K0S16_1372 [Moraxellaceae bacterium]|jgi:hypothetical protein|nr:hypothetical protein [Moraxellaceae bacterium]
MTAPDIEIYIADVTPEAVLDWLAARFPDTAAQAKPAGKRQWRLTLRHDGHALPVLVIQDAAPGWVSVWFDSPHTPWADDITCAREAFARFGTEVRATPGSWREGDDPDSWWHITAGGEGLVSWPG